MELEECVFFLPKRVVPQLSNTLIEELMGGKGYSIKYMAQKRLENIPNPANTFEFIKYK